MSDTKHPPTATVDEASAHYANDRKPGSETASIATDAACPDVDGDDCQLSNHNEMASIAIAAARLDDEGDESQLSDLDEEIFVVYNQLGDNRAKSIPIYEEKITTDEEMIPINEDTLVNLGKFRKQKGFSGAGAEVKQKKRRRRGKATILDDEPGPEQPVPEIELTEKESMLSLSSPQVAKGG